MYSISNIILRIEMSVVNLKIIFVKKQKQTPKSPTQGRGGRGGRLADLEMREEIK